MPISKYLTKESQYVPRNNPHGDPIWSQANGYTGEQYSAHWKLPPMRTFLKWSASIVAQMESA